MVEKIKQLTVWYAKIVLFALCGRCSVQYIVQWCDGVPREYARYVGTTYIAGRRSRWVPERGMEGRRTCPRCRWSPWSCSRCLNRRSPPDRPPWIPRTRHDRDEVNQGNGGMSLTRWRVQGRRHRIDTIRSGDVRR